MPRAKRHFLPGYAWHITHRCHKREFLLGFARDRRSWVSWLFEAKKRNRLRVLNYMATSNHIHLLVLDSGEREVIPRSMQLIDRQDSSAIQSKKKEERGLLGRSISRNSGGNEPSSYQLFDVH